eukprot:109429_1
MATMICALLVVLGVVRSSVLDKIGEYELIYLDVDNDGENPILTFHAFSLDYKIELEPNNDLIPSTIAKSSSNTSAMPQSFPRILLLQMDCSDIDDWDRDDWVY